MSVNGISSIVRIDSAKRGKLRHIETTNESHISEKRHMDPCQRVMKPSSGKEAIEVWVDKDAKTKADIVLSISASELNMRIQKFKRNLVEN